MMDMRIRNDAAANLFSRTCAVLAVLLSVSLSCHASGPAQGAAPDAIRSYLQPLVDNHTLAGAVTLIATEDRILYFQPVGFRDVAAKAAMQTNDLFWIASESKPMTATALMMLVDEGKVNLDDPVEKYLPEFKGQMVEAAEADTAHGQAAAGLKKSPRLVPANHPILVREILSHTAGLPFKSAAQPDALDTLTLKDSVRSFAAEPLIFQPNTDYKYSNEGLDTAGRIIEVVSGMPYEQFMQERLFNPLGMRDTTFWPDSEQIGRLAKSYALDSRTKKLTAMQIDQLTYPLNDRAHRYPMPAGGLFSTTTDVLKFCRMILNGGTVDGKRYISPGLLREMTSLQNSGMGDKDYGFGWTVLKNGFGHGGAYETQMEINTAKKSIFIFMIQKGGPWGTPAGDAVIPTVERLADDVVSQPSRAGADGPSDPR
jgi:CubicO group peptidase (beta-lactamase class C family)